MELIRKYGKDNLVFFVPMRPLRTAFGLFKYTSSSDDETMVLCKIVEERYKLQDNYKIELNSRDPRFGKESFYITDLNSLINSEVISVYGLV